MTPVLASEPLPSRTCPRDSEVTIQTINWNSTATPGQIIGGQRKRAVDLLGLQSPWKIIWLAGLSMLRFLSCRPPHWAPSEQRQLPPKKKKPKPKTKKQKRKKYGFRHINKKEKKTHRKGHNVWLLRCRQLVGKLVSDIESLSYLIISLTQTNETISRLASYSIMPRERRNINLPVLVRNRYVTIPPSPPLLNTESQPKTFPV